MDDIIGAWLIEIIVYICKHTPLPVNQLCVLVLCHSRSLRSRIAFLLLVRCFRMVLNGEIESAEMGHCPSNAET